MTPFSQALDGSGLSPRVPWRPADAIWTAALNVVGLLVAVLGWLGVSGTARLSHQFGWTSLAVLGFLLVGLGDGLWLLAGRRAVGMRRRALLPGPVSVPLDIEPAMQRVTSNGMGRQLVIGPGMTRYHRPSCMLVRGKDCTAYAAGRRGAPPARPCGICKP